MCWVTDQQCAGTPSYPTNLCMFNTGHGAIISLFVEQNIRIQAFWFALNVQLSVPVHSSSPQASCRISCFGVSGSGLSGGPIT